MNFQFIGKSHLSTDPYHWQQWRPFHRDPAGYHRSPYSLFSAANLYFPLCLRSWLCRYSLDSFSCRLRRGSNALQRPPTPMTMDWDTHSTTIIWVWIIRLGLFAQPPVPSTVLSTFVVIEFSPAPPPFSFSFYLPLPSPSIPKFIFTCITPETSAVQSGTSVASRAQFVWPICVVDSVIPTRTIGTFGLILQSLPAVDHLALDHRDGWAAP